MKLIQLPTGKTVQLIEPDELPGFVNHKVHVMGFDPGAVFIYVGQLHGLKVIQKPKTHKLYATANALYRIADEEKATDETPPTQRQRTQSVT